MGSNEAVKQLWVQSELDWLSLGTKGEDLVEFLEDHVGLCLIGGGVVRAFSKLIYSPVRI